MAPDSKKLWDHGPTVSYEKLWDHGPTGSYEKLWDHGPTGSYDYGLSDDQSPTCITSVTLSGGLT